MGFRKLYIAVNCETADEVQKAQEILDELSAMLRLNAKDLIEKAPLIRKNKVVISDALRKILSSNGKNFIGNLVSVGGTLLMKLKT